MTDEDQIRRWEDEGGTYIEERAMTETNVHTEHCCSIHGCKYGDEDCPVVAGEQEQSFPCADCEEDTTVEDVVETLFDVGTAVLKTTLTAVLKTTLAAGGKAVGVGETDYKAVEVPQKRPLKSSW